MHKYPKNPLLVGILLFFALLVGSPRSSASAQDLQGTHLQILAEDHHPFDTLPPLKVELTTLDGSPLPGQVLEIMLEGIYHARVRTDALGQVTLAIPALPSAGSYMVTAVYPGSADYQSSRAKIKLRVGSTEIQIHTVPSLSGVEFSLDGQKIRSGPDGIARMYVNQAGSYQVEILTPLVETPRMKAVFQRWEPESFELSRRATAPGSTLLQAGFEVSRPLDIQFSNLQGEMVDVQGISAISIKSSNGDVYSLQEVGEKWLPSNTIQRRLSGLDSVTIYHSVQQVDMKGSNVVNRGQQRFAVEGQEEIQIELLLYSLQFTGRDAIFGLPMGSGVELEYPDGSKQFHRFGPGNLVTIDNLPRGSYQAIVRDAQGLALSVPIVLSRDQAIVLPVISYLNLGLLSAVALMLLIIPILIGRVMPHRSAQRPALRKENGNIRPENQ